MTRKPNRDVEKAYPLPEFIAKLRRLADALERGERFEIYRPAGCSFMPLAIMGRRNYFLDANMNWTVNHVDTQPA